MKPTEEIAALADEYEAGTNKALASGYDEYGPDFKRKRQIVIDALRLYARLSATSPSADVERKFKLGDRVQKIKGSSWHGTVCGFYSTSLTPVGYAVESEREPGSVQIYPEAALELIQSAAHGGGTVRRVRDDESQSALDREAVERVAVMLRAAARYIRSAPNAKDLLIEHDDALTNGLVIADECDLSAKAISAMIEGGGK